jgi:hypothetical protein
MKSPSEGGSSKRLYTINFISNALPAGRQIIIFFIRGHTSYSRLLMITIKAGLIRIALSVKLLYNIPEGKKPLNYLARSNF